MMHKQDNISLIIKDLLNETNLLEAEALQSLKTNDEEFSSLHEDMTEVWEIVGNYTPNVSIDTQAAFDKFATNYDLPIDKNIGANAKPRQIKQYIAYAIALLLIIISSFTIFNNLTSTIKVSGTDSEKYSVPVADFSNFGSVEELVLAPRSELLIDKKKNNILNVDGSAFFRMDDSSSIQLGDAKITGEKVAFTVSNYKEDDKATISVESGKLDFSLDGKKYEVSENHSLLIDENNNAEIVETSGNLNNNISWVNGKLIFIEAHYSDVFSDVEKYFGVDIKVEGYIPNTNQFKLNSPLNPIASADDLFKTMHDVQINFKVIKKGDKSYIVSSSLWK